VAKAWEKTVFLGHRRFLDDNHVYRNDLDSFNGKAEHREPPVQPSRKEISDMTASVHTEYGKLQKTSRSDKKRKRSTDEDNGDSYVHSVEDTFKKRSVFFQLEYWETLLVRNNLDIMHI
jgi:hypothetical protein